MSSPSLAEDSARFRLWPVRPAVVVAVGLS